MSLKIPKHCLVVFTGLSGSGKSSLAIDTIYAEGQRRYMESLSTYARQFLGQLRKPRVDFIDGLSPSIAIERKGSGTNPRSTVGTLTEIYDLLRLLFARCGTPHCPECMVPIDRESASQMIERLTSLPVGTKIKICAPVKARKDPLDTVSRLKKQGFVRFKVDGVETLEPEESLVGSRRKKARIEVVVDRIVIKEDGGRRIGDSVEVALQLSGGFLVVEYEDGRRESMSENLVCNECNRAVPEPSPAAFSFNSPLGACEACTGIGSRLEIDASVLILDPTVPLREGLVSFSGRGEFFFDLMDRVAKQHGFNIDGPWEDLTEKQQNLILYGNGDGSTVTFDFRHIDENLVFTREYEGLIPMLRRRMEKSQSTSVKSEILSLMSQSVCDSCQGSRLKPEVLAVRLQGKNIHDICQLSIEDACQFFQEGIQFTGMMREVGEEICGEILSRLTFLLDVGLPYLSLDRAASTLSGGEMQRIHLACQIGARLTGVLYVLDEPTIGLHPHDTDRLVRTLETLRSIGNTLVVVEHDPEMIRSADFIVDLGPGAGEHGGEIVFAGKRDDFLVSDGLTARYLQQKETIPLPEKHRPGNGKSLRLLGARAHNLRDLDVDIPLGCFVCVTGISGSGKSSLVHDVLCAGLQAHFRDLTVHRRDWDQIQGADALDKLILIDQAPIGRSSRSNPSTYTGINDHIRELFSLTREARLRGYKTGRFSFNVKGGRCEVCEGEGVRKIEMHFLPDMQVTCEACEGTRFNRETLEIRYRDKTIADVLAMTIEEAFVIFQDIPPLRRKLECLRQVGLGYLQLGQPATTLSGGEAQRVKLAFELSKVATGNTCYVLDEPTTGLHFHDTAQLVQVLTALVDQGNTVVVIEHNLDVIKVADWVIDLGPHGGEAGGELVVAGTPQQVAKCKKSFTGRYLKETLKT